MSGYSAIAATKYPQKHSSGNVTWKVKIGKRIDGKFVFKNFKSEQEAENFRTEWNNKLVDGNNPDPISRYSQFIALFAPTAPFRS